ncbi:MAG: magnesium chelatase family protein [Bermanella sp.]
MAIARANFKLRYPARFQLIAAMNPCLAAITTTRCTPDQILRYRTRISGPLLDRIDIFVHVPRLPPGGIQDDAVAESSREIRLRVVAARERKLGLSARAQHRIIKVARTIADLAGADAIQASHLSEALAYRDGVSLRQNDRP